MKDIKDIRNNLPKFTNEKGVLINALPEYTIRTMKDDLARLSLKELEKEAKETEEAKALREKIKEKEVIPPEKLPVVPSKAPLPSAEELITKKAEELPSPPKPSLPKKEKPVVPMAKRPKILIFLIIIFLILLGVGIFFYWQGKEQPLPLEPEPEPQPQPVHPSESLIPVDEVTTTSISAQLNLLELLKQEAELEQTPGSFRRIAILKNEKEFFSLNELLQNLEISIPPYALAELKENYTLVLYNQNGKRHLVLITEVENPDNLKEQLRFWEETMIEDLKNFFLGESLGEPATPDFQDNIYQEIPIRYINFPEPDLTIDYAIIKDVFILTTSRESIYRIIDKTNM